MMTSLAIRAHLRSLWLAIPVIGTCLASTWLPSQDLLPRHAAQSRPILVVGATIHQPDGSTIDRGVLWFTGGKIAGIAKAIPPASELGDAVRVDATGLHAWPGLIAADTTLGLQELGSLGDTQDHYELGDLTPEVRASIAINPDSALLPVARRNGVLVAGVLPTGGGVPGRAAVIQLEGWTSEDMVLSPEAGLMIEWPRMASGRRSGGDKQDAEKRSRRARRAIERLFDEAKAYGHRRSADPTQPVDLRLAAVEGVLDGKRPVFLRADALEQIESAVAFALAHDLRAVIVGGRQADRCGELLVEHDIGVIVAGTHRLPSRRDEDVLAPFTLPKRLADAGVKFCIARAGMLGNERNLPYQAATAVAYGLSPEAAMRAITSSAAELLGVAERVGSIAVGKDATVIFTDGHPLEITTHVRIAFIQGRRVDLRSKQTELAEKYRIKYRQLGLWPKRGAPR